MRAGPNISNSHKKSNPAVPSANGGLANVLVEIGHVRAKVLEATKQALLDGDDAAALEQRSTIDWPSNEAIDRRLRVDVNPPLNSLRH